MAENNVEIKSEEKTVVTKKVKNPANIEKGKKLVEWNKKNKEKIRAAKEKKSESDTSSYINYGYGGFALGALLIGGYYYFYYSKTTPPSFSKNLDSHDAVVTEVKSYEKKKQNVIVSPKIISSME